jgi:phosphoglycolate phosphatase-like HAD superfamily hydrolase
MRCIIVDALAENKLDVSHVEGLIPKQYGLDAVEVPGARNLLASLEGVGAPWAIVTSGTRPLVTGVRPFLSHTLLFNLDMKRETFSKAVYSP